MSRLIFAIVALALALGAAVPLNAQEPRWTGRILKVGPERAAMDALPIEQRPYRPLHFYGNTVRRQYYRGTPVPMPRDFVDGARAFLWNR